MLNSIVSSVGSIQLIKISIKMHSICTRSENELNFYSNTKIKLILWPDLIGFLANYTLQKKNKNYTFFCRCHCQFLLENWFVRHNLFTSKSISVNYSRLVCQT